MLQLRREGTLIQTRNTLKPRTIITYMHACLLAAFVRTCNVLRVCVCVCVYSVATASRRTTEAQNRWQSPTPYLDLLHPMSPVAAFRPRGTWQKVDRVKTAWRGGLKDHMEPEQLEQGLWSFTVYLSESAESYKLCWHRCQGWVWA